MHFPDPASAASRTTTASRSIVQRSAGSPTDRLKSRRSALPSLWHAMPSKVSALSGVCRLTPVSCALPRLAGPLPPPALPGFIGTTDLPPPRTAQPDPCGSPVGGHAPPPSGFPVFHRSPYACMPSPLPRRIRWLHMPPTSPTMAAFPVFRAGRLPHSTFRGLLSVHSLRPACSQSH